MEGKCAQTSTLTLLLCSSNGHENEIDGYVPALTIVAVFGLMCLV